MSINYKKNKMYLYADQLKQLVLIILKSLNLKNATMKYFFRTTVQTQNTICNYLCCVFATLYYLIKKNI